MSKPPSSNLETVAGRVPSYASGSDAQTALTLNHDKSLTWHIKDEND